MGANEFTPEELEALFRDEDEPTSPSADDETTPPNETTPPAGIPDKDRVDTTKAFANRLKESTEKAVRQERERFAKELGFESYTLFKQNQEATLLKEKGLDAEQVKPVVEELVKQRLENDPRFKDLDRIRAEQVKEFGKKELAEITKLTDGEITRFDQLPEEVLKSWASKGSLKAAYLELKGEELIFKVRSEQNRGSTNHLKTPGGSNPPPDTNKRLLTEQEKSVYRFFNPKMSEDELSKITTNK